VNLVFGIENVEKILEDLKGARRGVRATAQGGVLGNERDLQRPDGNSFVLSSLP
jgi:hypothetical protein